MPTTCETLAQQLTSAIRAEGQLPQPGARELPILHGLTKHGEFLELADNVLLRAVEMLVASGRVYTWGDQVDAITAHRADENATPMRRVPCPNLWYHAYIFWDGTLTSCERDYDQKTPLGNVRDGVLAAWNGPAMRALRAKHRDGDFTAPACERCVEWSWWTPTTWHSKGTAPNVETHRWNAP